MSTPTETVAAFLALWDQPGAIEQSFRDYFTAATVWENVGLVTTTGPDEAMGFISAFEGQFDMAQTQAEMLAVAESGNKVLTERIDHIVNSAGETVASVRVMGIFEVAGGKIAAWRDYFDTAPFVTK